MGIGKQAWRLWLLLLLPLQAAALSMGDLTVRSVPGEPLRAHIPFTLLDGENLAQVRITLASSEQYQKHNLSRTGLLDSLRLALLDRGEGKGRVQLYSELPWQGDAVQLLLLVSWSQGEMERQYQLAAVTPVAGATPVYVEVAQDETLDQIAMRLSKGSNRSYLHMMYALFQANPEAFYRGNMNNLKSGQTLRVPSSAELYALSDREVFDGIRSQYEQWQQSRESGEQQGTEAGAALSGMSAEQAAGLDLSADAAALQQRLQQVAAESEAIRRENEELRARLQALEQRMENVAGQVLEYADEPVPGKTPEAITRPTDVPAETAATGEPVTKPEAEQEEPGGLSGTALFAAIALVLLFVYYILYSTGHQHRGRE